jgi:hypothetical protein
MDFKEKVTTILNECRKEFPNIDDDTFYKFAKILAKEMYLKSNVSSSSSSNKSIKKKSKRKIRK